MLWFTMVVCGGGGCVLRFMVVMVVCNGIERLSSHVRERMKRVMVVV